MSLPWEMLVQRVEKLKQVIDVAFLQPFRFSVVLATSWLLKAVQDD